MEKIERVKLWVAPDSAESNTSVVGDSAESNTIVVWDSAFLWSECQMHGIMNVLKRHTRAPNNIWFFVLRLKLFGFELQVMQFVIVLQQLDLQLCNIKRNTVGDLKKRPAHFLSESLHPSSQSFKQPGPTPGNSWNFLLYILQVVTRLDEIAYKVD